MNIEKEKNIYKRNDTTYIFSFLNREINSLNDINTNKKSKKESMDALYQFLVVEEPCIPSMIIQEVLIAFNKNFIKLALFDSIDTIRESALKILIHLYSNCTNAVKFFPFIFSALVDKLECGDLEGISDLPEDIRPTPSQKPHKVSKLTETCEENRILYVKLLESLIFNKEDEDLGGNFEEANGKLNQDFRMFVQDIVNITRTLCMDPCTNVVLEACVFLKQMARKFGKELLFYFNSILSRSLYYALTHRQSKLRLASLNCLEQLMFCSPYKKNVEIMEQMVGFRDPNVVPIKDFYEPSTKMNYMAFLVSDPSPAVVKRFFEVITGWMLSLEDRFDHEARLIPYILSGLFSQHEDISLYVVERLELIGKQYEIDNEKEIRESKQYAIDSDWVKFCTNTTNTNGVISISFDKSLYYPFPLGKRPCLGARLLVKKYLRRYVKNLCKEYESIEESIKIRVSNLILYSIAYAEEGIIEYLDQVLLCFERELVRGNSTKGKSEETQLICDAIIKALRLLGRFCDYESITNLLYPTICGDLNGNYPDIQKGGLICLRYIIQGHLESILNSKFGFGIFQNKLSEVVSTIGNKKFIDYIDSSTGIEIIDFYLTLIEQIVFKKDSFKSQSIVQLVDNLDHIFEQIIQSLGALAIFDLHGVSNSELVVQMEKKMELLDKYIMELIDFTSKNEEIKFNEDSNSIGQNNKIITTAEQKISFFAMRIKKTLNEISCFVETNNLTINTKQYKIFFIFLKQNKLFLSPEFESWSIIEINKVILNIFTKIFASSYNFSIHQDSMKLLSNYLTHPLVDINNNAQMLNFLIEEIIHLMKSILKPYDNIEIEKFKFADLLKDEKEVEKKKLKSPKTVKSEIREKCLLMIKTLFNKNEVFTFNNQNSNPNNSIVLFLNVFDNLIINEFAHERESGRKLFSDLYYQFLVKLFTIKNVKVNIRSDTPQCSNIDFSIMKSIINNFEDYFKDEVFDSTMEVRQNTINIFNLILCCFEKSEFFEPMGKMFASFNEEKDLQKFNFESLKVLAYSDQENKRIDNIFKNFKNMFSVILNLYIDDKTSFGILCEGSMKYALEKLPIFCFNEWMKARNKNQMTRIEVLDKMFSKYLKLK